jgi:hypothetical protein
MLDTLEAICSKCLNIFMNYCKRNLGFIALGRFVGISLSPQKMVPLYEVMVAYLLSFSPETAAAPFSDPLHYSKPYLLKVYINANPHMC